MSKYISSLTARSPKTRIRNWHPWDEVEPPNPLDLGDTSKGWYWCKLWKTDRGALYRFSEEEWYFHKQRFPEARLHGPMVIPPDDED